jgi:hypothetical protein
MDVPALLSADDMINPACDELSMMTYLAGLRAYYDLFEAEIQGRLGKSGPQGVVDPFLERVKQEADERLSLWCALFI